MYGNLIYIKAITQALFLDLNKFLFFDPITLLKNLIELRYFDTCRKIQFPTIFLKIVQSEILRLLKSSKNQGFQTRTIH